MAALEKCRYIKDKNGVTKQVCDPDAVSSSTSGLKIEVVTEMPSEPDSNTIYVVK